MDIASTAWRIDGVGRWGALQPEAMLTLHWKTLLRTAINYPQLMRALDRTRRCSNYASILNCLEIIYGGMFLPPQTLHLAHINTARHQQSTKTPPSPIFHLSSTTYRGHIWLDETHIRKMTTSTSGTGTASLPCPTWVFSNNSNVQWVF